MRISDWSSDVCSSDLILTTLRNTEHQKHIGPSSGGEFRHGWKEDCTAGGSADHSDRYSVHGAQHVRQLRRSPGDSGEYAAATGRPSGAGRNARTAPRHDHWACQLPFSALATGTGPTALFTAVPNRTRFIVRHSPS